MQAGQPRHHAELNGASLMQVPQGSPGWHQGRQVCTGRLRRRAGKGLKDKIEWCGAGGLLYTAISGVGSAGGKTPALPQQGLCSKGRGGKLTTLHAGRVIGIRSQEVMFGCYGLSGLQKGIGAGWGGAGAPFPPHPTCMASGVVAREWAAGLLSAAARQRRCWLAEPVPNPCWQEVSELSDVCACRARHGARLLCAAGNGSVLASHREDSRG